MSDQRIRHLFEQLDGEPSAEFEASLRSRLLLELTGLSSSAPSAPITPDKENQMVLTTERTEASAWRWDPSRRVGSLLAVAAAIGALVVTGFIVTRNDAEPTSPPTTPVPQTTVPPPQSTATTLAPVSTLPVLDVPTPTPIAAPSALTKGVTLADPRIFQVKFDGFNLWAGVADSKELLRIDPATGTVVETFTLPSTATQDWLVANQGRLYVMTYDGIVIVNGETKEISAPLAKGDGFAMSVAFTKDSAWVLRVPSDDAVGTRTNTIEQWDLGLTVMQQSVDIGGDFHPGGIVGIDNSFFISTDDRGLLHYDDTGTLTATIADVGYSFDIGASAGSVWVPDYDSGELIRIDPATDEIVARIFVAGINAHSVFATDTSVWVTTFAAGNINVIDPATNLLTAQINAGQGPMSVAVVDGAVWVAGEGRLGSFLPT